MPDYSGYTIESVRTAIQAGQSASLGQAATAFASARTLLESIARDVPMAVKAVTDGSNPAWEGPAATAFRTVVLALIEFVEEVAPMLAPYKPQLGNGETALHSAQAELGSATTDAQAQSILTTLAGRYGDICQLLGPIATTPAEVITVQALRSAERNPDNTGGGVYDGPILDGGPFVLRTELAGYTGPPLTFGSAPGPSSHFSGAGSQIALGSTGPQVPIFHNGIGVAGPNPTTSLTTARRIAGIGAVPHGSGMAANQSPMMGPLAGGRSSGLLGGQSPEEEQQEKRQVVLVGDEDWTDQIGVTGAIGRPLTSSDGQRHHG